ncbi:hypothetical protein ACWEBX_28965 [Streptomyces sp. NPDC005070]
MPVHDSPFRSVHRNVTLASLCVATALTASALVMTPAFADSCATPVTSLQVAVDHVGNNGWD